jgi:hypothetical protein
MPSLRRGLNAYDIFRAVCQEYSMAYFSGSRVSVQPPLGAQASRLRGGQDSRVLKVEGKMPSLRRGLDAYGRRDRP